MKYRVLVVDDQAMPRQLFENIITNSDRYTLVAALDSAQLADIYCARGDVDLVLMDVVMKHGANGLQMAAKLKKSYPQIKIIIVTSMPDVSLLQKAKNANVDSFWYKEVQDTPMLELMDRTMAGEQVYPRETPEVSLGMVTNTQLTDREMEVLRLVVGGLTDKEIAEALCMSYHTVRFHMNTLLSKTSCTTRTELAICAVRSGIVVPDM